MTSRPMPSPGNTSSFLFDPMTYPCFAVCGRRLRPEPGLAEPVLFLERGDIAGLLQGEPDVIEPVQQAVLAEGIELEFDHTAIGAGDRLIGEVYGQPGISPLARILHQLVDDFLRQLAPQGARL